MTNSHAATPVVPDRSRPSIQRRLDALLQRLITGFLADSKRMRRTQFQAVGLAPGHVVLLGDSITEGGLWDEWFPHAPVVNRGIAAETSAEVLARLDTAINAPRGVFLLIGTNDLGLLVPRATIVANVRAVVTEIERRAPGTPVFVQSVMPRIARYTADIRALNAAYQGVVAAAGPHVTYIDLWPALAAPDGTLRTAFTNDSLHLTGVGYAAWVEVLRPHIVTIVDGR